MAIGIFININAYLILRRNSEYRLCYAAFECVGLTWEKHVMINPDLIRPSDPLEIKGLPLKAAKFLSWTPQIVGVEVVKKLVASELVGQSSW